MAESLSEQLFRLPKDIKRQRLMLGLSRPQLARKAGVSESTIERAEAPGGTVTSEKLIFIVAALGGEVAVIFDGAGGKE